MSSSSGFSLTPHKLSMCILLQAYASGTNSSPPSCVLSLPLRHKLSLFVLQTLKAHENFLEPTLDELSFQLKFALDEGGGLLVNQLVNRLIGFSSPEDLFAFALGLRELLSAGMNGASEPTAGDENPLLIDSNSFLGHFVRRCILAFNILSFEATCKILADIDTYRQPVLAFTGDDNLLDDSTPKRMDDVEVLDEENLNDDDDDDYFDFENIQTEVACFVNIQKSRKSTCGDKGYDGSFQILGCRGEVVFGEANFNGRVQDGGFTFAFGDLPNGSVSSSEGLFLRTNDQVESYMRVLADSIEREVGSFTYEEVDSKLSQLEKLAPDFYKVHYLRYLNCLSNGDYPAAIDSLHRYFDFSAGKGAMGMASISAASTGRFQAGLLALGSLHARFGHTSQALQALNEAVGIAQQNNDDSCLAHALAALCYLVSDVGIPEHGNLSGIALSGSDKGDVPTFSIQEQLLLLLKCCLRRAVELRLPHLVSFSRLVLAKFNLKFVGRSPLLIGLRTSGQFVTSPIEVCKTLKLSPYLLNANSSPVSSLSGVTNVSIGNIQRPGVSGVASGQGHGLGGRIGNAGGGNPGVPAKGGPILSSILQLAGTAHLLRAASWELYGSAPMARISALIHATCYRDIASADDMSLAYVKLAQYLATHKSYDEAFAALEIASKKFPLVAKSRIKAARLQLAHERALHRGEIKIAQTACDMLAALSSPVPGVDVDHKIDVSQRHARTLLAAGQFSEAASVAHSLFVMCYRRNMQLESIMVLLLLADINKKAETFVSGLPYALAALTLSKSCNLDLIHAAAMVTLAELWLGLGASHAEKALALLHQCMTMVLGHGGHELKARIHLAVARCYLDNSSFSVHTDSQTVLDALQSAAEEFEVLEDHERLSEVFYLRSMVFHMLGAVEKREHAASLFQKYTLAHCEAQAKEGRI